MPSNPFSYANMVTQNQGHTETNLNHSQIQGNSSGANPIDSNTNPLFLHNNDHPGLVLIAKKLTGTENYGPWKRSMQIALSAKNKLVIVNGSYAKPASDSPFLTQWDRVNDMVITWILNTVSEEISDGMNFVNSAAEVWNELNDRFSSVNGHRIYQLLKDMHSLEQDNKSVEIYYHKLKNLWDEYSVLEPVVTCSCGALKVLEEREQRKKLIQFLMGLHDSYSTARGQILMMNPLPSITQAFSLIKQDEKQRQGHSNSEIAGLLANGSNVMLESPFHKHMSVNNPYAASTSHNTTRMSYNGVGSSHGTGVLYNGAGPSHGIGVSYNGAGPSHGSTYGYGPSYGAVPSTSIVPSFGHNVMPPGHIPQGLPYYGHHPDPAALAVLPKDQMKCSHCNREGHLKETCFKIIGYPPKAKKKGKPPSGNYNFRNTPKVMQATTSTSDTHSNQIEQLQSQVDHLLRLMPSLYHKGKGIISPEEHVAGPEFEDNSGSW